MLRLIRPFPTIGAIAALIACAVIVLCASVVSAEMDPDTSASHFGQYPAVWGMRLAPDGQKVSFLRMHPEGFPIAMVIDLRTGKGGLVLASDTKKEMDLRSCLWATTKRLLCEFSGLHPHLGSYYSASRLVAVNMDGSNSVVLAQRQQRDEFALDQGNVVDLLPDEPDHILIPIVEDYGQGVSRVDIRKNKLRTVVRPKRSVWGFLSDGRGNPRIRLDFDRTHADIQYRVAGDKKWRLLHRSEPDDLADEYWPLGFGKDLDSLYVTDTHEGRSAIFKEKLSEDGTERTLVYAHPEFDVGRVLRLGKYRRPIGVAYAADVPRVDYFDEVIAKVSKQVRDELDVEIVTFIDESWDRLFYLVHASSDVDGGRYYRFDAATGELSLVTVQHPWLDTENLAPMRPVRFPSKDGQSVPGYVTRLSDGTPGPRPAIILPHGGPTHRDRWGYDWLVQYFASQGYVVLQANYRGSSGYGNAWRGAGAFRAWKTAMTDIEWGARYLVEEGLADPDRICVVGWSYGGYAALLSAIEYPERYRCVVSVAGVTNPVRLFDQSYGHRRRFLKAMIGRDPEVVREGSPLRRAKEVSGPVLLVHGKRDITVDIDQSEDMAKKLEKFGKDVTFLELDDDHSMRDPRNRIEMLQKIGTFLERHLEPRAPAEGDSSVEAKIMSAR